MRGRGGVGQKMGLWCLEVEGDGGGGRGSGGRRDFGASPGQVDLARCYGGREMRMLTFSGRRDGVTKSIRWKMVNDEN